MEGDMQSVDPQPVSVTSNAVAFEPYSPEFDRDPFPTYRALREHDPVHWWETSQAWVVSRYDDVALFLRDRRFSLRYTDWELARPRAAGGPGAKAFIELFAHGLFSADEAAHTRMRKLVSPAFTPRAIEQRRNEVEAIVRSALGSRSAGETLDVGSFAEGIPLRVIESMLGIPPREARPFRDFAVAVAAATSAPWLGDDEFEALVAPVPAGVALVRALIEERRAKPGGDLLSTLIEVEEEGERLTTPELVTLVASLIIAGSETTVHGISFGAWSLLRNPSELALFVKEPSLARAAVDELLRYDLFGRIGSPRYAREDVVLHGRTIRKGQMALLLVSSALRDETVYAHPDRLDLRRDNSQTLSFGGGPHYCLGAALARLEIEVALGALFRVFPGTVLAGEPVFGQHLTMRKLASLPVRLGV
jgi:cytochrome P450 enzyme